MFKDIGWRKTAAPAALAAVCLAVLLFIVSVNNGRNRTAVSGDGTVISYSVRGKGGPVLVFVHGWSCDRSVWERQVPYFARDHRVIALDLAGHGRSGKKREVYSPEAFGGDVAAVVRAEKAREVILIGHSMGGPVVISAAGMLDGDVMAVIGVDTLHDLGEEYTPEQVREIVKPFKDDFRKATGRFIGSMFVRGTDPALIRRIGKMMTGADPRVGISALEEMFSVSCAKRPPVAAVPVWALNSDLWQTKPAVNRRYLPDFNLRIMPGAGHFLMLERPAEFNKRLERIVQEIVKRKAARPDHGDRMRN